MIEVDTLPFSVEFLLPYAEIFPNLLLVLVVVGAPAFAAFELVANTFCAWWFLFVLVEGFSVWRLERAYSRFSWLYLSSVPNDLMSESSTRCTSWLSVAVELRCFTKLLFVV